MKLVLKCLVMMFFSIQLAYAQEGHSQGDAESAEETNHERVMPSALETTRTYLREDMVVRKFKEDDWKEVVAGVDYSEEEEPARSKSDAKLPFAFSWDGPFLRIVAYILAGFAVLIAVYFVIRNIPMDIRAKKRINEGIDPGHPVEDIESLDARSLLDSAIREGDIKLAVRLYYLSLLKGLNEKGFIVWKKDKTNRDYLGEVYSQNFYYDDIRHLTLSYESVWYGDHGLRPESFSALSNRFEVILERINNGDKLGQQ